MINVVWARSGPFFPNHQPAAVCVASERGVVGIKTNSNLMQQVEFDRSILATIDNGERSATRPGLAQTVMVVHFISR